MKQKVSIWLTVVMLILFGIVGIVVTQQTIDAVKGRTVFLNGLRLSTTKTLQFRDANAYLYSNASGYITTYGTIKFAQADTAAFTTTETLDTVLISGVARTSMFLIQPKGSSLDAQDIQFQYHCTDDTLFVTRAANGASGLVYVYMWVK